MNYLLKARFSRTIPKYYSEQRKSVNLICLISILYSFIPCVSGTQTIQHFLSETTQQKQQPAEQGKQTNNKVHYQDHSSCILNIVMICQSFLHLNLLHFHLKLFGKIVPCGDNEATSPLNESSQKPYCNKIYTTLRKRGVN